MLVAMLVEDMLADLGHETVCTLQRLEPAKQVAAVIDADAAILDVNLAGDLSFPVAEVLERRGIPFLFASGYGRVGLDDKFAEAPVLAKPFTKLQLEAAISKLPQGGG
jgi:two-component SAPR family response regulator